MLSWQPGCLNQTRGFPSPPRNRFGSIINYYNCNIDAEYSFF